MGRMRREAFSSGSGISRHVVASAGRRHVCQQYFGDVGVLRYAIIPPASSVSVRAGRLRSAICRSVGRNSRARFGQCSNSSDHVASERSPRGDAGDHQAERLRAVLSSTMFALVVISKRNRALSGGTRRPNHNAEQDMMLLWSRHRLRRVAIASCRSGPRPARTRAAAGEPEVAASATIGTAAQASTRRASLALSRRLAWLSCSPSRRFRATVPNRSTFPSVPRGQLDSGDASAATGAARASRSTCGQWLALLHPAAANQRVS